ncbi:MAG: hypothetical protein RLZZ350_1138, partial [Verrucomicrobiota bacterium]
IKIRSERSEIEQRKIEVLGGKPKPLEPEDMASREATYQRLSTPKTPNFSMPHNLFNPVPWQRKPDGTLIKIVSDNTVGPGAVAIVKMNPLYTTISVEASTDTNATLYVVIVEREAELLAAKRRKKTVLVSAGAKNEFFAVRDIKGTPDKPELKLELTDTGAQITITPEQPFKRVDGYSVDLKYEPEKNRAWTARRVGDRLGTFAGDDFSVAAINLVATNQYEVVLSARSTGKKTTIRQNAGK